MLRNAGFLALFLIAFIYNGVAFSLLGWVALFMQESAGFSTFSSISMISVFYVALTAGRFLCAAYAERLGYAATLLILAVGLALTYPLVIFSTTAAPLVIGIFLTGLTLSGLFPTALAYGTRLYPPTQRLRHRRPQRRHDHRHHAPTPLDRRLLRHLELPDRPRHQLHNGPAPSSPSASTSPASNPEPNRRGTHRGCPRRRR